MRSLASCYRNTANPFFRPGLLPARTILKLAGKDFSNAKDSYPRKLLFSHDRTVLLFYVSFRSFSNFFDLFRKGNPDFLLKWMREQNRLYLFESPLQLRFPLFKAIQLGINSTKLLQEHYGRTFTPELKQRIGNLDLKNAELRDGAKQAVALLLSKLADDDLSTLSDAMNSNLCERLKKRLSERPLSVDDISLLTGAASIDQITQFLPGPTIVSKRNDTLYMYLSVVIVFRNGLVTNTTFVRPVEIARGVNFVVEDFNAFHAF